MALRASREAFQTESIETEGAHDIRGCVACGGCAKFGRCVFDDIVNELAPKFETCDGLVVGSPVYYASANATLVALLTRLFYSTPFDKTMMVMVMPLAGCAVAASAPGDIETSPIAMQAAYVVLDIAATAAATMIGVAGAWALAKIGQNKNLANLNIAIGQVIDAAQQTVGELQQTVVGGLKAAASDGKLTEAQIAELKRQLLRRTSEKLTAPVVQMLEAAKLDVNALIQGAAEDMINSMHTTSSQLEQSVEVDV